MRSCLLKFDSFQIEGASLCGPSDGWERLSSELSWEAKGVHLGFSSNGVVIGSGLEAGLGEETENPQVGQVSLPVPVEPH